MTNSQENRANRIAESKGYRLEKTAKGTRGGLFAIVDIAKGSRVNSGIKGSEYSFTLPEAEVWLLGIVSSKTTFGKRAP
jgi:hypothetical protein